MIFYFAGNGRKLEDVEQVVQYPKKSWGILLSYKDLQTKDGTGGSRFRKLKTRKENTNENR